MTNKYVQAGRRTNVTLTAAAMQGGLHDETDRAGVYLETGVTGDVVPVAFEGRFELAKTAGASEGLTAGQKVYSDGSEVTSVSLSNTALGYVAEAAATGDTTAIVDVLAF